jgi:hypothetical protein
VAQGHEAVVFLCVSPFIPSLGGMPGATHRGHGSGTGLVPLGLRSGPAVGVMTRCGDVWPKDTKRISALLFSRAWRRSSHPLLGCLAPHTGKQQRIPRIVSLGFGRGEPGAYKPVP